VPLDDTSKNLLAWCNSRVGQYVSYKTKQEVDEMYAKVLKDHNLDDLLRDRAVVEQRSAQWFKQRKMRITASKVASVCGCPELSYSPGPATFAKEMSGLKESPRYGPQCRNVRV